MSGWTVESWLVGWSVVRASLRLSATALLRSGIFHHARTKEERQAWEATYDGTFPLRSGELVPTDYRLERPESRFSLLDRNGDSGDAQKTMQLQPLHLGRRGTDWIIIPLFLGGHGRGEIQFPAHVTNASETKYDHLIVNGAVRVVQRSYAAGSLEQLCS
ncbi:hypothetical protein BDW62DRAFT_82730 [Aspergillus aurantiobrunneus]